MFLVETGFAVSARLVLNSWPQVIHPPASQRADYRNEPPCAAKKNLKFNWAWWQVPVVPRTWTLLSLGGQGYSEVTTTALQPGEFQTYLKGNRIPQISLTRSQQTTINVLFIHTSNCFLYHKLFWSKSYPLYHFTHKCFILYLWNFVSRPQHYWHVG